MSRLKTFAIISLLLSSSLDAHSATIEILKTDGLTVVRVTGELSQGDGKVFVRKMLAVEEGIVDFNSPGGNLMAGLAIGRAIRLAGFRTAGWRDLCVRMRFGMAGRHTLVCWPERSNWLPRGFSEKRENKGPSERPSWSVSELVRALD